MKIKRAATVLFFLLISFPIFALGQPTQFNAILDEESSKVKLSWEYGYSDGFDTERNEKWHIVNGHWSVEEGTCRVSKDSTQFSTMYWETPYHDNFIFQADVRKTQGSDDNIGLNIYGSPFTQTEYGSWNTALSFVIKDDYWILWANDEGSGYAVSGSWKSIKGEYKTGLGEWNRLKIAVKNGEVALFINGTLQGIYSYSGSYGYLGLRMKDDNAGKGEYDNIVISPNQEFEIYRNNTLIYVTTDFAWEDDLSALPSGDYQYHVVAKIDDDTDSDPSESSTVQWAPVPTTSIQFTQVSPNPTNGADLISISAEITGSLEISSAEFFMDQVGETGTGSLFDAVDGSFDGVQENVTATYNIPENWSPGEHTLYARVMDSEGTWHDFTTMKINHTLPGTLLVPGEYATIQAAVNAAAAGDVINVAPGIYKESFYIYKALSIVGAGPETTIIDNEGEDNGIGIRADNVTLSGITLRNMYGTPIGIVEASHCRIENVVIKDVTGYYKTAGYGINLSQASSTVIENVDISGITGASNWLPYSGYGIYISQGTGNQVKNCTISDIESGTGLNNSKSSAYAIYLSDSDNALIQNCLIHDTARHEVGAVDCLNLQILGCTFDYDVYFGGSYYNIHLNGATTATIGGSADNANILYSLGNETPNPVDATYNNWNSLTPDESIKDQVDDPALGRVNSENWIYDYPPEFTSSPVTTAIINHIYTYEISASDQENDALIFQAVSIPDWLNLTDNGDGTATLTGTAPETAQGEVDIELKVITQGKEFKNDVQPYTLNVVPNIYLTQLPDARMFVGKPYNSTIAAATLTGDIYPAISIEGHPDWITFTDNGNGTALITATPPADSRGAQWTLKINLQAGQDVLTYEMKQDVQFLTAAGLWTKGGAINDVIVKDNLAFAVSDNGLYVIDGSTHHTPVLIGRHDGAGGSHVALEGNTLVVAVGSYFGILDVADPSSPVIVKAWNLGSDIRQIRLQGNILYALNNYETEPILYLIDINDPQDVKVRYQIKPASGALGSGIKCFDIKDQTLYAYDWYDLGDMRFNISDPDMPVDVSPEYEWPAFNYVSFDKSNPEVYMVGFQNSNAYLNYVSIGGGTPLSGHSSPCRLDVKSDCGYAASLEGGVEVIIPGLSPSQSPGAVYKYSGTSGSFNAVAAGESCVYIAGENGLYVVPAYNTMDTDGNYLMDTWETDYFGDLGQDGYADPDGDGLNNFGEHRFNTDPDNADSDNDGIPDNWELSHGLDPLKDDAGQDPDNDGLTNSMEYQNNTNPYNSDTDDDGMPDEWEVIHELNPVVDDANEDADDDQLPNEQEYRNNTDPHAADTDNDGMPDVWEVRYRYYGLNPILNDADDDLDNDGVSNILEYQNNSYPNNPESRPAPRLDSVEPGQGVLGKNLDVTLSGDWFDATTQVIMSPSNDKVSQGGGTVSSLDIISAYGIDILNDTAYVAAGYDGLKIINISDPAAPETLGSVHTPGEAVKVAVLDNIAYVADDWKGLQIINVSDPTAPQIIGSVDTPGDATDLAVVGNIVYVADDWKGLQIINMSDPTAPRIISSVYLKDAVDVVVADQTAYVANGYYGLSIINVSNPENPKIIATMDTSECYGVEIAGKTAYVASSGGLEIVNIANPYKPESIGFVDAPQGCYPRGIKIINQTAYLLMGNKGIQIIDVNDSSNAEILSFIDTINYAYDLMVVDDIIYIMESGSGSTVVRSPQPFPQVINTRVTAANEITMTITPPAAAGTYTLRVFNRYGVSTLRNAVSFVVTDLEDTDNDMLPDSWEKERLGDLDQDGSGDADNDGLSNILEYQFSTNPIQLDSDGDGMPDGWEVKYRFNPLVDDAGEDADNDGFINIEEYIYGSDPSNVQSYPRLKKVSIAPILNLLLF